MNASRLIALTAALLLAACSFQNKYESQAQKITQAVINNDMRPVQEDLSPRLHVTRVQVAEASDELNAAGKLLSIKETTDNCPAGVHCFDVKFEKHAYVERMQLDENGKVVDWHYRPAPEPAPASS